MNLKNNMNENETKKILKGMNVKFRSFSLSISHNIDSCNDDFFTHSSEKRSKKDSQNKHHYANLLLPQTESLSKSNLFQKPILFFT